MLKGGTRLALAGALALTCVVHALWPGGHLADVTYVMGTLGAGIVGLRVAFMLNGSERQALLWIAAGVTCSGIGDICYTAVSWINDALPDASVADVFYLASYVIIAVGLLVLVQAKSSVRELEADGLIDMGSFAVLSMIVVAYVVDLGDVFHDNTVSLVTRLVWTAYPILDGALLAVVVRSLLARRMLNLRGLLLAFGIVCWLGSDFATLLIADASVFSTWMDLGWILGAAATTAAMLVAVPARSSITDQAGSPIGGARVAISLCPLLAPGIIEIWAHAHGQNPSPLPLFIATVALVLLAIARSTRLVRARNIEEAKLKHSERYFQALAENSADAVIVIDTAGRILNDSPHLAEMVGRPGTPTIGLDAIDFLHPRESERARRALERMQATTGGVVTENEVCVIHADGFERWFAYRAVNRTDDPVIAGLIVNLHEITDRKRVEAELVHRALHDSLTGLANRALFHDRVDHALRRTAEAKSQIAVVYMDVDSFKGLNDSRGHEAGDVALCDIAGRLLNCVRSVDTVARLGGDEFAVLIESPLSLESATATADRIQHAFVKPFELDDREVILSASIGIAIGDRTSTASSMLRDADIAMYNAKKTGKAKWTVYEPQMRTDAVERLQLEIDLHHALVDEQFMLVYQPIIELDTDAVVGFEALLRWNHPTRGVVKPDAFVPVAEANGSIVDIGRWVLNEACRTAAEWNVRHPERALTMAVNLSTRQLARHDFVEHVRSALRLSGLPASALVLEMTESVLVHDPITVAQRLHELHDLGLRLAVDDFGTGYSSLSYLRQFPVDILKIDRSFVHSITERDSLPAIVRGLLELGRTLDLETVAEGIELPVQRDSLREQHCRFGQGFLFSHPLMEAAAGELLERISRNDWVSQMGWRSAVN